MKAGQDILTMICMAVSILASGCGPGQFFSPKLASTPSTIPTGTPIPTWTPAPTLTFTPTPTPRPWVLFSDGIKIGTICLEVSQIYSDPTNPHFSLPIYETIEKYLSDVGLIVADTGEPCSGTLSFSLTGEPLGAQYSGPHVSGSPTCYAGAYTQSETTFSVQGKSPLYASSEYRIDPPMSVEHCQDAEEAPYEWHQLFFRDIGNLWGPEFLYFVIETSANENPTEYAGYALAYLRPELQTTLVYDLGHGHGIVRQWVANGLVAMIRPTYSGTSDYIEWDFQSTMKSTNLIEAARTMQPTLIELLADDSRSVRAAAALLLGMIGPDAKEAVPSLINALLLEEQRLELEAKVNCSTTCGYDFLLNDEFFLYAIWAISRLDGKDAIPTLIDLLRKQEEPAFFNIKGVNMRPGAIRVALSAITGQDFGVSADLWQQWWETQ